MKKVLMILGMAAIMAACGDKSQNSGMNSGENTEENAGEVASPALEDTTSTMESDTLSTPSDSIQ
jgi:hypothetical protein